LAVRREEIIARLEKVKQRLEMYYQAEAAILNGAQEYRIGSRSLKRGDLQNIREEIAALEKQRDQLETALATCTNPNRRKAFRVLYRDL